jgi:hypothetical protein
MLNYYPVSIVTHGVALNITLESYNGSLDFGLVACRKAVPDLPDLAGMLVAAHRELLAKTTERAARTEGSRRKVVNGGHPRRRSAALTA